MVSPLTAPTRPLTGGSTSSWLSGDAPYTRIYHQGARCPTGLFRRAYGPLDRFDHHTPAAAAPGVDPGGRSILYVGRGIGTCGAEVFGDAREANVCPSYRAVVILPVAPVVLQDLTGPGVMGIGALLGLSTGDVPRVLSQAWARAIYEDHPTGLPADGVRYVGAHDGGRAAAIWDRAPSLAVAQHPDGTMADVPLTFAPVWRRFLVEMRRRGVVVRRIGSNDCPKCP
jgi:hypothetical protein